MARRVYSAFADRYAAIAPHKPHNALYERPATLALLGDVRGLRVLDAGCGPGICCELLARRGAAVHGFDVTPEMVELARRRCAGLDVEIAEGDLAARFDWLADASFDAALCSLALDYVEDLGATFAELRRVVRPGGAVVFSMAHPMRDWMDERSRGASSYFDTARFSMRWPGFGEPAPVVESYRRPLEAILKPLAQAGWRLEHFVEPRPLPAMREIAPELHEELTKAPAFICVRALRAEVDGLTRCL